MSDPNAAQAAAHKKAAKKQREQFAYAARAAANFKKKPTSASEAPEVITSTGNFQPPTDLVLNEDIPFFYTAAEIEKGGNTVESGFSPLPPTNEEELRELEHKLLAGTKRPAEDPPNPIDAVETLKPSTDFGYLYSSFKVSNETRDRNLEILNHPANEGQREQAKDVYSQLIRKKKTIEELRRQILRIESGMGLALKALSVARGIEDWGQQYMQTDPRETIKQINEEIKTIAAAFQELYNELERLIFFRE